MVLLRLGGKTFGRIGMAVYIGQVGFDVIDGGAAVSYTHLDVYKRQVLMALLWACSAADCTTRSF